MLNRAYEWYRIASPNPKGPAVESRGAAAGDLVEQFTGKASREVLVACVQGVVNGFSGGFTTESPAVQAVLQAIKTRDAAVASDLSANALELRAVAAIALGEVLHRQGDKQDRGRAALVAMAFRAGLAIRPRFKEKFLQAMVTELVTLADGVLLAAAEGRRRRATIALQRLDKVQDPADAAAALKETVPALKGALRELQAQTATDREELDVLWWMFNRFSQIGNAPLRELGAPGAAFCAGLELADIALLPPSGNMGHFVRRVTAEEFKAAELAPQTIQQIVDHWTPAMRSALAPEPAEGAKDAVKSYPSLLPVTWACRRIQEGGTKWGGEFATKTGLPAAHACGPADWGIQVFNERVLQRSLADGTGS